MISLIAVIFLILALVFSFKGKSSLYKNDSEFYWGWATGFYFLLLCALIAVLTLGIIVSGEKALDKKIEIYIEENEKIEEKTYDLVIAYLGHESDLYESITKESSITLIQLYPELKSNELIKNQLSIYLTNTEQIKQLKSEKANLTTEKFWLYFGN